MSKFCANFTYRVILSSSCPFRKWKQLHYALSDVTLDDITI